MPADVAVSPTSRVLTDWRPEDEDFWRQRGRAIARRNLSISIPALLLAFAVWMVWSAVVVKLPQVGFAYGPDQLFWLAALPGLSGATLRIFYSFMVPIFGGRRLTAISTASLSHAEKMRSSTSRSRCVRSMRTALKKAWWSSRPEA